MLRLGARVFGPGGWPRSMLGQWSARSVTSNNSVEQTNKRFGAEQQNAPHSVYLLGANAAT